MKNFNIVAKINKNGCSCVVNSGKRNLEPLNVGDYVLFKIGREVFEGIIEEINISVNVNYENIAVELVARMSNGGIEYISIDELI